MVTKIVPKSSKEKKEFGVINSIYWHTHRSTVDKDDYQEYDKHNNNAKNNVALKILPDDELECFSKVR